MTADWRDRYAVVRMTAEKPVVHRWGHDEAYATKTPCGIRRAEARSYTFVLTANLHPDLRRCLRCWPPADGRTHFYGDGCPGHTADPAEQ